MDILSTISPTEQWQIGSFLQIRKTNLEEKQQHTAKYSKPVYVAV